MSKLRVEEKDGVISNSRDQEMAIVWVDTVTEKLHVRADEDVEIPTRRR